MPAIDQTLRRNFEPMHDWNALQRRSFELAVSIDLRFDDDPGRTLISAYDIEPAINGTTENILLISGLRKVGFLNAALMRRHS
jgi:hypothetical protein